MNNQHDNAPQGNEREQGRESQAPGKKDDQQQHSGHGSDSVIPRLKDWEKGRAEGGKGHAG